MQPNVRRTGGFTLIELMITVAIIAILAAIAYPSYLEHIRKARRAEAQSALMDIATRQQQRLLDTRSYASGATLDAALAVLKTTIPASVSTNYTVTITTDDGPPPTFDATAVPKGAQVGDKCGTLKLTNTGAKTPDTCW